MYLLAGELQPKKKKKKPAAQRHVNGERKGGERVH